MDLISRQAVIDVLAAMQGRCTSKAALIQNSKIWQQIKDLPSAQIELSDEEKRLIKQLRSYHNGSYAKVIDKLVASVQPELSDEEKRLIKQLRSYHNGSYAKVIDKLIASAQPMRWIPCSEKPIVSGMYIVTLKDKKGLFTDTAEWNPTFGGRWQSIFYDDDAIGEYRDISNVVAWMPLPEPYKGEGHETDRC